MKRERKIPPIEMLEFATIKQEGHLTRLGHTARMLNLPKTVFKTFRIATLLVCYLDACLLQKMRVNQSDSFHIIGKYAARYREELLKLLGNNIDRLDDLFKQVEKEIYDLRTRVRNIKG